MHTHQFQDNYIGAYTELDEYGLQKMFRGICEDIRPFRVVQRYLQDMGYTPGITDAGNPVLIYLRNGKKRVRCISDAKLLYICRDESRKAQGSEDSFRRLCAEEDESEIELLIGLHQNSAPRNMAPRNHTLQQGNYEDECPNNDDALIREVLPEKARRDDESPHYLKF